MKRRYILKFVALCLAVLLPFAAYFAYVQAKPAVYGASIMGTVRHKLALLEQTPGPRVILVGGSSSPYATDCAWLEEQLGLPVINIGATVYLGLDFYLSMLDKNMREGDIIVIAPEHVMLRGDEVNYETVWAAVENHPEVWAVLPAMYLPGMARSYHQYAGTKLARQADGPYDPDAYHAEFGPLGDVVAHREPILESGYNTEDPIALDADTLNPVVAQKLNRFAEKAAKRGAQVLFAFAPVDELAVTTAPADWQALDSAVRGQLHLPVLGTLAEAVMAPEYFYNSNNHLTSRGAQLYSRRLAAELQPYLPQAQRVDTEQEPA